MKPDLYQILGVPRDASEADIRRAFRKRSEYEHPDKLPLDAPAAVLADWTARFQLVTEAYTVLSDEKRREAYDHAPPTDLIDLVNFGLELKATVEALRAPSEPVESFARRVSFAAATDVFRLAQTPNGKRTLLGFLARLGQRPRPPP